jgi:hypothetical protein
VCVYVCVCDRERERIVARRGAPGARFAACRYSPHPTPCTRHSTPDTLHPTLCTLHPAPCNLQPAPCTLHPSPYTLHTTPCTLHPSPLARSAPVRLLLSRAAENTALSPPRTLTLTHALTHSLTHSLTMTHSLTLVPCRRARPCTTCSGSAQDPKPLALNPKTKTKNQKPKNQSSCQNLEPKT